VVERREGKHRWVAGQSLCHTAALDLAEGKQQQQRALWPVNKIFRTPTCR
jgi:hypothetical protein